MGDTEKIYEVDLQDLVEKYVWRRYREDMGFLNRLFLRKSKYFIDIRWGFADFHHTTTHVDRPLPVSVREKHLDLYRSEYENETSKNQTYTFSTSRETAAMTNFEIQDSYTLGAETNLEVDLGGMVKFGGGVSGEKSHSTTKGEEHTTTQSWNIDTEISVPGRTRATATLELKEIAKVTDFTVETIVSLPKGKLPVSIRKLANNENVKTYWITNISKIFDPAYLERSKEIVEIRKDKIEGTNRLDIKIKLTTHGVCKSTSGKEQRVKVEYKTLTSESNEAQSEAGGTNTATTPVVPVNMTEHGDGVESVSENENDVMLKNGN